MKILTLSCSYGRDAITALWLDYQKYLRGNIPLETLVVYSEDNHGKMIKESGAIGVKYHNKPLGKKWNYGLKKAKKLDWDYLQIMGSDDLLSPGAFDLYKEVPFQGFLDFYVFDSISKQMAYWRGYNIFRAGETIGAGRLISRELVDKLKWKLWVDERNKGLDRELTSLLKQNNIPTLGHNLMKNNEMLVDIKGTENLGSFEKYNTNIVNNPALFFSHYFPGFSDRILKVK